MTITMNNHKFFSLVEAVEYHYRPGDYQVPLYDEHYELYEANDFWGGIEVTPAIRRNGSKTFVELAKPDYEVRGNLLVYKIPVYQGDVVRWSFYGKLRKET